MRIGFRLGDRRLVDIESVDEDAGVTLGDRDAGPTGAAADVGDAGRACSVQQRSWMSGRAGIQSLASWLMNITRFMSAIPSRVSTP